MPRVNMLKLMSDNGAAPSLRLAGEGNTSAPGAGCPTFTASNTARAAADNGTLCTLPAFMRRAGTTQIAAAVSTSPQVIPRTSPVRAAVRMAKRKASAAIPTRPSSAARKAGTCCHGKAGWCATARTLRGAGSSSARLPRQRAGLSPVRSLRARA